MTSGETIFAIASLVCAVVVNFMIVFRKKALYESKYLWVYYMFVKGAVVFPAVIMVQQFYIFAFEFVGAIGNPMYHMVYYCYIGYIIIAGFIFFMEDNQVNLLRLMSVILLAYQAYMAKILIDSRDVLVGMGDSPMNPFRYGDTMGYFICCVGPILSFIAVLTVWHYWKGNDKVDFI